MDCDGVIGETGVDDSDWVYSKSDNEGDLGFSDQGATKAGPILHEPGPEKNIHHCCHMTIQIREIALQNFYFRRATLYALLYLEALNGHKQCHFILA
jgi:hypothetical protein